MTKNILKIIISGLLVIGLTGCGGTSPKANSKNNYKKELTSQLNAIKTYNEDKQLKMILDRPRLIKGIENPSKKLQLASVQKYGYTIQYIKNPDKEVQLYVLKNHGIQNFQHINNPDIAVQKYAINNKVSNIVYIKNPSVEIQRLALEKQLPEMIKALQSNQYLYNVSYTTVDFINNMPNDFKLKLVKLNSKFIQYIKNPSKEIQSLAPIKRKEITSKKTIKKIKRSPEVNQLSKVKQLLKAHKSVSEEDRLLGEIIGCKNSTSNYCQNVAYDLGRIYATRGSDYSRDQPCRVKASRIAPHKLWSRFFSGCMAK